MMKRILAMLLAAILVLSLAACGSNGGDSSGDAAGGTQEPVAGGDSDTSGGEKVQLNVIISQYGNNTQDWWPKFEEDFEKTYDNIDLTVEIVSWNDLYTVVNTRISTQQAPDILNIDTFADYVADDLLVPAEDYTSAGLKDKIIPSFWNANELDGTVWALPILASCRAMFCNMDLLAEAGITAAPTTWEEVDAACKAVKDKFGGSIVPWGLDISADEGQAAFAYYTWNNGGGFVDAEGNWALNSAANVEAMNYIKTLIDNGFCNANPYTDTRYPLQDAFNAGSQAMMIGACNMMSADSTVNYEVANLPSPINSSVSMGVCDRLMVFDSSITASKNADEAARLDAVSKFFDFFYDTNRYSEYMVFEGFLPVTSDSSELLKTGADQFTVGGSGAPGDNEYFATFTELLPKCEFYPSSRAEWIDVKQGVIEAEQRICQGEDAQTVLDELQAKIEDLQAQNENA